MFKKLKKNYKKAGYMLDNKIPIKFKPPLNDWRARLVLIIFSLILSSIIIGTLSLSHFLNYFKNTNDCRNSYEITQDISTLLKLEKDELKNKVVEAYDLCKTNHQAQAFRVAYVAETEEDIKKYFEEVDVSKLNPSNLSDRRAGNLMYVARINIEKDENFKINLIGDSIKFAVNPCSARLEQIDYAIKIQQHEKGLVYLNKFKTDYQKYNEFTNCYDGIYDQRKNSIGTSNEYFDYLIYSYKIYEYLKMTNNKNDIENQLKEFYPYFESSRLKVKTYEETVLGKKD